MNRTYFGLTKIGGIGTSGAEFHVEWGETAAWQLSRINVFDLAEVVYIKIMEW